MTIMRGAGLKRGSILAAALLAALPGFVSSAEGETRPNLEHDILPLLKARCLKCHGPVKPKGKLNLSNARSLARGGSSGPVVVPGKLDESTLWDLVSNDEMPPEPEEPLPAGEKALLRRWIEQGARNLPDAAEVSRAAPATDHWAFAPAARPPPPTPRDRRRVRTPVDRFIQKALEDQGLDPRSRRRPRNVDPPPQLRPDGPAAATRGDRGVPRRPRSGCLHQAR